VTKEQLILIIGTGVLTLLGLAAILTVVILRPSVDNTPTIKEITAFIALIAMQFIGLLKSSQAVAIATRNGSDLQIIKTVQDGQTSHAINQAAQVATLTEQIVAIKTAAELAAKVADDTAKALAAKKEG
jgi:hypothetical protein